VAIIESQNNDQNVRDQKHGVLIHSTASSRIKLDSVDPARLNHPRIIRDISQMFVFLLIQFLSITFAENSIPVEKTIYSKTNSGISTAAIASQYGIGRLTNGSLGEYNFLRSDCLLGNIVNKFNQTTVLPSLSAKTPNPSTCLRGNGVGSIPSVYQSSRNISQFISTIVSKKLGSVFTVDFWFHPNATMKSNSEIFSLRYLGNSQPYFQVFIMNKCICYTKT
jgi:hypothetical protein